MKHSVRSPWLSAGLVLLGMTGGCEQRLSSERTEQHETLAQSATDHNAISSHEANVNTTPARVEAQLSCAFQQGDRLAFKMVTTATLIGDMAALGPGIASDTRGIDQTRVHNVELRALETTGDGPTLVQYAQRAEGEPFRQALVRIAHNCRFEDIGVLPSVPAAERNGLLNTLATLEFVGASSNTDHWSTDQHLPFGRARIAYRSEPLPDGRLIIRRRVAAVVDGEHLDSVRETGNLTGWVQKGHPWLVRLELDRQVLTEQDGVPTAITEKMAVSRSEASLQAQAPGPLDPKAVRWVSQTTKPLGGHNRSYRTNAAPPGLEHADRKQLVRRIVAGLRGKTVQALLDARRLHVYAMRARTDLAQPLLKALQTGRISGHGVGALLLGLTDAGTPEAEAALVAIVDSPKTNRDLRRVTAMQMHRQVAPTRTTVHALLRVAERDANNAPTRHAAWASLGALVGYGRLPLAVEGEVRELLSHRLAIEKTQALQLTLLSALGNTRNAALVGDVERFTTTGHAASVRVHAMVVLERMGAPPSPSQLLDLAQELHDVRHLNRLERLARSGDLIVSDADVDRAFAAFKPSASELVRSAAVQIIARRAHAGRGDLRHRLASLYAEETSALVKQEIGRHVPAGLLRDARLALREIKGPGH